MKKETRKPKLQGRGRRIVQMTPFLFEPGDGRPRWQAVAVANDGTAWLFDRGEWAQFEPLPEN